jgi:hypothetical protein
VPRGELPQCLRSQQRSGPASPNTAAEASAASLIVIAGDLNNETSELPSGCARPALVLEPGGEKGERQGIGEADVATFTRGHRGSP